MVFIEDLVNLKNLNNNYDYQIQDGDCADAGRKLGGGKRTKRVRATKSTGLNDSENKTKDNITKCDKRVYCNNINECTATKKIIIFNSSQRSKNVFSYQHLMSQLSQLEINLLYTAYYDDFRTFDYKPFP